MFHDMYVEFSNDELLIIFYLRVEPNFLKAIDPQKNIFDIDPT